MPSRRSFLAAAVVAAAVVFVVLGACSRDEAAEPTTTTTTAPEANIELMVTNVESNGTAPPSDEVIEAVVATLDSYVADAIVAPLQTGDVGPDLKAIFTPSAGARATGADRDALAHEHLPRLPRVRAEKAAVSFSTLAGPDGQIGVMVARLDLAIRARGADDDFDITHAGDLVFVPEGATWKVDSYTMHTTRDRHPEPTPTKRKRDATEDDK